jgi:hypothetical protein
VAVLLSKGLEAWPSAARRVILAHRRTGDGRVLKIDTKAVVEWLEDDRGPAREKNAPPMTTVKRNALKYDALSGFC